MADLVYALSPYDNLLSHSHGSVLTLRDGYDFDELELEASIRSGDYFATLATVLDDISQTISETDRHEGIALERIVKKLLYMQQNYEIKKKASTNF